MGCTLRIFLFSKTFHTHRFILTVILGVCKVCAYMPSSVFYSWRKSNQSKVIFPRPTQLKTGQSWDSNLELLNSRMVLPQEETKVETVLWGHSKSLSVLFLCVCVCECVSVCLGVLVVVCAGTHMCVLPILCLPPQDTPEEWASKGGPGGPLGSRSGAP